MGAFNTAVITDAGEVLLAKIIAGTETLNLTSAKTSDYEYPAETSFKALTDLQGIKQTMANPTAQVLSDTVIGVQALFGNQDVAQAYDIWNIGLYAMDGDNEILFSISSAQTPDQMPAFEGVAPSSYIYDIRLAVSQAADITIEVNPAGTVTQEQLATKVTANGGNIGDTVVNFDDSGSVPDITSFPAFLATLVSGSKIGTFFRNFLAGAQFLLHVGSIVNNCVTDNPELPLSAAQGKVLMDLYTVLNTKLNETSEKILTSWPIMAPAYSPVSDLNDVKNLLSSILSGLSDGRYIVIRMTTSAIFPPFNGGTFFVSIARVSNYSEIWGTASFICYATNSIKLVYMSCVDGVWGEPITK